MKKTVLLLALAMLTGSLYADSAVKPAGITDWIYEGRSLTYKDGIGRNTGYMLISRGFIPVTPSKKYIVEGEFRAAAKSKPAKFQLGMVSLSGQRRVIRPENAIVVGGSAAVLEKAAVKGSKKITVKTTYTWNPKSKAHVVVNADNSGKFSDLPNFNVIGKIVSIKVIKGKTLEVTLSRPLNKDLAAGTNLRLHSDGGIHVCSKPVIVGKEWKKFSHVISGYSKGHTQKNFRHGAKYAKIFILHHRGSVLEFRNLSLKELPAGK